MKKTIRLALVVSLAWILLAFPSFWVLNINIMRDDAEKIMPFCMATYPNDYEHLKECRDERDKLFEQMEKSNKTQVALLTLGSLALFWIIGFVFVKSKDWIKKGS